MSKSQVPVLPGWFAIENGEPHLLGTRCRACGTYYFPRQTLFCRNPDCESEAFDEVPLSRRGTLWSYTNAMYQPPEPFVAEDPHVPYTILAVELEREKMIVLGQGVAGLECADLRVGMPVQLVLDTLFERDGQETITWKWAPLA
ncbi:benzoylsuccinyl-CoA thiolase [Mangrovimicrobium sediminis]|uniref:Benzoylsuccinyl-CoA thiolase n=1 Tax=Mangrovimicrobium sediminis TaxID=2562682 RepID=A0A4Z0LV77_9GAMM|nr:OB-fold domain-containing protein [Haliea sp. SAOS-164]TGD71303.1 benzoylsuccinyl-CoA thiolase [Haliea sp. SAOS-164]